MKYNPIFIGFCLSAGLPAPVLAQSDARHAPCTLQALAEVDMQTLPDGRVVIPVKIDGHDYRFMIDTGGAGNTVESQVAKREAIETHEGSVFVGVGNNIMSDIIHAGDFAIGELHGKNYVFHVDKNDTLLWDGTLTPPVLAAFDVDIDFAHEKFKLFSPNHCPGGVVYWTDGPVAVVPMDLSLDGHIQVPVRIDGKTITADIDTGSVGSVLSLRQAWQYLDVDEKSAGMKSLGNTIMNGMRTPAYSYPFAAMTFGEGTTGSIAVNHPRIEILPDQTMRGMQGLVLGVSVLRQLHMYIAYKERKLYLSAPLAGLTPKAEPQGK